MFYIYEWFIKDTDEVIYVGKGFGRRIRQTYDKSKLFKELTKRFACESRKISFTEDENEAFDLEEKRISYLHSIGQAVCNKVYSGNGGVKIEWTNKMRSRMSNNNPMKDETQKKRMSVNNPMKNKDQRKRMSEFNPMKNTEVAIIVGIKHRKEVIINGVEYESGISAASILNVTPTTIVNWCKKGFNRLNEPCSYK